MTNDIIESIIDVGSGFLLAIVIQLLIFPLFDLYPSILDSMGIALVYQTPNNNLGYLIIMYEFTNL
jgi:hypothetical protein